MNKQYIKTPIPEAISEDGGASVQFVNKSTVGLSGAIDEAIEGNYVLGQKPLILNSFIGLMGSMCAGVQRDGHARQIGNYLTVYPQFKGEVDLDKGYDPEKNAIQIKARLLNEMEIDISDWTFQDVTLGKKAFTLQSVHAGGVLGVYNLSAAGEINGKKIPNSAAGEDVRVDWAVEGTDKAGTIDASKVTSNVTRIDIAADALDELKQPEYDGKTIVFTVRGNYSNAKIPATIRYVEPPPTPPTLTKVHPSDEPENDGWMKPNPYENTVEGTNLATATKLEFKYVDGEDEYVDEFEIVSKTADSIVFKANAETMEDIGGHLIVTTPAGTCEGDFMATVMGS